MCEDFKAMWLPLAFFSKEEHSIDHMTEPAADFTLYVRSTGITGQEAQRLVSWLVECGCVITRVRLGMPQQVDYERVARLSGVARLEALRVLGSSGGIVAMDGNGDIPNPTAALPLSDSGFLYHGR